MRVTVIGAGVAGLACATELHARGVEVTVVDRAAGLGAEACSWWAGGMLAPWCELASADPAVARLGSEAAEWWQQHSGGVVRRGTLVLALGRDAGELRQFARRTKQFESLDAAQIDVLEPALAGRFRRGLLFPSEAHLDPRAATATLAQRLHEAGTPVRWRTAAEQAPPADLVLDCRGLAARDELDDLRGVKGEMLLVRSGEITLTRTIRLLHPRTPVYIVPRGDGLYMIGATMIENSERSRISARSMLELLGAAYALHPAFGEAEIVEIGVDARPAFADNLPRLRRRGSTLFVNGLYRHGLLLSPALARMAADTALDAQHVPEVMDENCP